MGECAHTRARTHPNASRDTMSALESREATVGCRVRSLKNCAREKWCRCVCKCMIVCVCARERACACAGLCVRVSMFVCVGVRACLCGRAVCLRLSVSIYVSVSLPISLSRPILNRPPPGAASHTHTHTHTHTHRCARVHARVSACASARARASERLHEGSAVGVGRDEERDGNGRVSRFNAHGIGLECRCAYQVAMIGTATAMRSGHQWQATSMAGVTWRQHRYGRVTPGRLNRIGFQQRLRARLHAGLCAASVVGYTDPLSARNVASDVGYLSTSSLPLGLVRGPRAVTRPRHFQRPYNRPASPVSPPNRLTSHSFPIEPTKTRLQYINISVVSLIPKKSWLPRVLNAYLDFSIPVTDPA